MFICRAALLRWLLPPGLCRAVTGDAGGAPLPLLDPEILLQFTGGDEGLRLEILGQFLESTIADIAGLEQALGGSDLAEIRRAAHRTKGASRMVGALAFGAALERIEHAATLGRDAVDAAVPAMRSEGGRLQAWLKQQLGG